MPEFRAFQGSEPALADYRGVSKAGQASSRKRRDTSAPPGAIEPALLDYAWSGDVDVVAALLNHG